MHKIWKTEAAVQKNVGDKKYFIFCDESLKWKFLQNCLTGYVLVRVTYSYLRIR